MSSEVLLREYSLVIRSVGLHCEAGHLGGARTGVNVIPISDPSSDVVA